MKRFNDLSIGTRLVAFILVTLLAAWTVQVVWVAREQEAVANKLSSDLAETVNQLTMAQLMFMKETKTVGQRQIFYRQIQESLGVKNLRVIRDRSVTDEMGTSDDPDAERADELERQALASGKTVTQRISRGGSEFMRTVIPAIAVRNYLGRDCLECHTAEVGQVLGAVSMEISLESARQETRRALGGIIVAAAILTALLVLAVAIFVRNSVTRPLRDMTLGLQDIARGEADLTRRLPVRGMDECGQGAQAFNDMMDKLQPLIASAGRAAADVAEQADRLAGDTARLQADASSQSSETASVAAAVEEMTASIASVAKTSEDVRNLSTHSRETAEKGHARLNDLRDRITEVETAVGQITAHVQEFLERTRSISNITREVREIANQTNLLALNAAIEAARAGEAGRGFAVVADEVRKLAEKSGASAAEIDHITSDLDSDSESVKTAIQHGLQVLQSSRDAMALVATVLEEARSAAEATAGGVDAISGATAEQHQTSSFIAGKLESIARLAEESRSALMGASAAAERMALLSRTLQGEMGRFRT